jgi:hypothetical protein
VIAPGSVLRFANDRSGNVLILFTLMFFVLALLTGAAIDVSRAVQLRTDLQNAADAAALAGVADFTSFGRADHQQAITSDYMNASVLESGLNDVDFTVTAAFGPPNEAVVQSLLGSVFARRIRPAPAFERGLHSPHPCRARAERDFGLLPSRRRGATRKSEPTAAVTAHIDVGPGLEWALLSPRAL